MRFSLTLIPCALLLASSVTVAADEDSWDTARQQLSAHIMSLGSLEMIQDQMTKNGRSDNELKAALINSYNSLAECIVDVVVAQAQSQNLPAEPVLKMMSGIYSGPEDVESVSEIEVIQSFDFDAVEPARKACQKTFMDEIE